MQPYRPHRDFTQAQLDGLYYSNNDYRQQVGDDVRLLGDQHYVLPDDASYLQNAAHTRVAA